MTPGPVGAKQDGSGLLREDQEVVVVTLDRKQVLRSLGTQVRKVRLERGMRQEDLAIALGLSVAYVSLIERGRRNPPITTVLALAEALNANPTDLLVRDAGLAEVAA